MLENNAISPDKTIRGVITPDKRLFDLLHNSKSLVKNKRIITPRLNMQDGLLTDRRVIFTSTVVNRGIDDVYQIIKDVEGFPKFMKWVKAIIIHERENHRAISEWLVDFEDAYLAWKQEEIYDDSREKISFNMLNGDFDGYCGEWNLSEMGNNKTLITLKAKFDWGMPNIEVLMGHILRRKARYAMRTMLLAIKKEVGNVE